MDPIKVEKLQALKRYRKTQLLQILFQYCLTLLVLALCFSKSVCVCFPSFCSFLEDFLLVTLPKLFACLMGPKCLFFLFNVILVVLVSQSKLGCPTATSPESDVYEEYMRRRRRIPSMEESKKITKTVCSNEVSMERSEEEREDRGDKTERLEEEEEPEEEEEEEEEGKEKEEVDEKNDLYGEKEEDEEGENNEENAEEEEHEGEKEEEDKPGTLPTDELTRRIEEFIAQVNYERRREAERLVCCG